MKKLFTFFFAFVWALCAFAQLPYNTTMTQNHFKSSSTVVESATANWDSGVRLGTTSGLNPGNWNDKYVVIALNQTSIPYQLKFKYKCNSMIASNANWSVAESSDKSTWVSVWTTESNSTSTSSLQTVDLSKSTKYIKLCYSGNYSGTFSDITVSDQAYVNDPVVEDKVITSLDFGTNTISSGTEEKTFDIEWCNVNALSVTCDNTDFFSVNPASFGGKVKYGTQTITVGYNRNKEVGEHSGTITITNGSNTKTVTLSGTTTKREQAIHWNAALEATNFTLNAEDALTGADLATADNEEAEITYVSDNTDVIAVSEDGKTIYAIENGTANVTVTATGNDIYNEGTDTKQFTVTSNKKQTITWEQNFMSLKTNANPKTIELTATATSGGEITYALEEGSEPCVTLNGNVLTITGTPGVAYITATQAGGEINDEVWIPATARKQIKVRDPNAACDEYALADQSFSFEKAAGMKQKEFSLTGKPTQLTFYAKYGGKRYLWSEQEPMFIEQYANSGSGLEWQQVASIMPTEDGGNFGPYTLDETATKIRFRSGEYGSQNVSNISVPRKKELVVSESAIVAEAERNVKWTKTISVSRSNIDVVDIAVVSDDPECKFEVSKTSIGTDCADRTTETFDVTITPRERDSVYTGTITITDGKAVPTTHVITLSVKAVGFNQSINDFVLPTNGKTADTILMPEVTTTSGLTEIQFLSSDSTVAYVENNQLVILQAGTVTITAYQAGDDKYNPASATQTIVIALTPVTIIEAPRANDMATGEPLSTAQLIGGKAEVEGSFAWVTPDVIPAEGTQTYEVLFTPERDTYYATATTSVQVNVMPNPATFGEYADSFCEGDSVEFKGVWYAQTTRDSVLLTDTLNRFGGDSIVIITMTMLKHTAYEEYLTIVYGTDTAWNGIALNDSTVGEHIVTYVTTNAAGCDSTVTLYLTVEKQQTIEQPVALSFCQGGFEEFRDKTYTEAGNDTILALGDFRDTLYIVNVTVLLPSDSTEYKTIVYGADTAWNGIALNDSTVGAHIVTYVTTNAAGCDSTVTLYLTVEKQQTIEQPVALSFCQGGFEEFRDKTYTEAGNDTILALGDFRDTLYIVNVTVLLPSDSTEYKTIVYGAEESWNGIALNDSTVGEHIVTYVTTNAAGCDSTVTLYLTVEKQQTIEQPVALSFCEGGFEEFRDKTYTEAGNDTILALGDFRDTLYIVNVTVLLPSDSTEYKTIVYGAEESWNGIALKDSTVGEHIVTYVTTNAAGCDSTVTLYLTVEKQAAYEAEQELNFCEGDSVEFRDKWYTEAGVDTLYAKGEVRDTILYVSVAVNPVYAEEWSGDTITVGDTFTLPSGLWLLGDSIVQTYVALEADTLGLTFVQHCVTDFGCDSTITLYVTVLPKEAETPETPTAIEQVHRNEEALKQFRNGVIYIRREGKEFTIDGRLVK